CLTIFLPKELDHHQTEEIRREADRQIERNHVKYVIFDFGETSFMDSSGIGVMMGRYRKLSLTGGEVWAANLNDRMKKILKMSGAAKIIRIYEDERQRNRIRMKWRLYLTAARKTKDLPGWQWHRS